MDKNKFLIVGGGGRESAFAIKLSEDTQLFAVMGHKNPTIEQCVQKTKGEYQIGNSADPQTVLSFAKKHKVDYVFVSADDPLANGVIDVLLDHGIKAIGGTRQASRIEWDKIYSIEMVAKVASEYTPFYRVISDTGQLNRAIEEFKKKGLKVVVKPQGLTGGKGVKVMPEHLSDYQDCIKYADELLLKHPEQRVLLVEKLEGIEFTIMGITDGENLVLSPASYDYPFRFEDDKGPGTGGMGCFTGVQKKLPFMDDRDLQDCKTIMQRVISQMKEQNLLFNGVLNGGFFKTKDGIKFMEFNARFGDPEGLNVLSLLKGSFSELLIHIWKKTLSEKVVNFANQASVVKYLVAKEYPMASSESLNFKIDKTAIEKKGVTIFFASCEKLNSDSYMTLKRSRVVAFGALADTVEQASDRVNDVIENHFVGDLEYRKDIGSSASLKKLKKINDALKI